MKETLRKSKNGAELMSGARDTGKPHQNREGDGFHCGRKTPKPEVVRDAKPVEDGHARSAQPQIEGNFPGILPEKFGDKK